MQIVSRLISLGRFHESDVDGCHLVSCAKVHLFVVVTKDESI